MIVDENFQLKKSVFKQTEKNKQFQLVYQTA
jgi:hypothetical protein